MVFFPFLRFSLTFGCKHLHFVCGSLFDTQNKNKFNNLVFYNTLATVKTKTETKQSRKNKRIIMVFIHGNCHGGRYSHSSHRNQLYLGHIAFMYLMMSLISSKIQTAKRIVKQNSGEDNDDDKTKTKNSNHSCQRKCQSHNEENEDDKTTKTKNNHVSCCQRKCKRRCNVENSNDEDANEKAKHCYQSKNCKKGSRCGMQNSNMGMNFIRGNMKYHICDTDISCQIHLDVPGVKHMDMAVDVLNENIVRVAVTRCDRNLITTNMMQHLYIRKNSAVNVLDMSAVVQDGVLILDIPKVPPSQPIEVTVADMNETDSFIQEDEIIMELDLPGIKSSDIKIQIHDHGKMFIHAKRNVTTTHIIHIHKTLEIDMKRIVDINKMKASLMNGVLIMTAPTKTDEDSTNNPSIFPIHVKIVSGNSDNVDIVAYNDHNDKEVSQKTEDTTLNHKKYEEDKSTTNNLIEQKEDIMIPPNVESTGKIDTDDNNSVNHEPSLEQKTIAHPAVESDPIHHDEEEVNNEPDDEDKEDPITSTEEHRHHEQIFPEETKMNPPVESDIFYHDIDLVIEHDDDDKEDYELIQNKITTGNNETISNGADTLNPEKANDERDGWVSLDSGF